MHDHVPDRSWPRGTWLRRPPAAPSSSDSSARRRSNPSTISARQILAINHCSAEHVEGGRHRAELFGDRTQLQLTPIPTTKPKCYRPAVRTTRPAHRPPSGHHRRRRPLDDQIVRPLHRAGVHRPQNPAPPRQPRSTSQSGADPAVLPASARWCPRSSTTMRRPAPPSARPRRPRPARWWSATSDQFHARPGGPCGGQGGLHIGVGGVGLGHPLGGHRTGSRTVPLWRGRSSWGEDRACFPKC